MGGMIQAGVAGAQMLAGLGQKIGAAVKQAKADKIQDKANLQGENFAAKQAADAANPLANSGMQAAMTQQEQNNAEQMRQNAAMNAIGGATEEMALAQNQQMNQSNANAFATMATTATETYNAAQKGMFDASQKTMNDQVNRLTKQADSLNKSGDNAMQAGMSTLSQNAGNIAAAGKQ